MPSSAPDPVSQRPWSGAQADEEDERLRREQLVERWESHLPRSPQEPRLGLLVHVQALASLQKHFCFYALCFSLRLYLAP